MVHRPQIKGVLKERAETCAERYGYETTAEFVRDAVRRRCEQLEDAGALSEYAPGLSDEDAEAMLTAIEAARDWEREDADLETDGGLPVDNRPRRDRGPQWSRTGGDGLPVPQHADADQFWLFTCCQCGRRWVDPPGPPRRCSCESTEIVCHRFDPDAYWAIKRHGDPRVRTDGGVGQTDLERDPTTREVAQHDADERNRPTCPDCGQYVGASKGGGKPLPDHEATAFGWECGDCELTLPSSCSGAAAPMFNDRMAGLEVVFRDGIPRWVPVPARYVDDADEPVTDGGQVLACPACKTTHIRRTASGRGTPEVPDWHCLDCDERFDDALERASESRHDSHRSRGLAARLADPDVTDVDDLRADGGVVQTDLGCDSDDRKRRVDR